MTSERVVAMISETSEVVKTDVKSLSHGHDGIPEQRHTLNDRYDTYLLVGRRQCSTRPATPADADDPRR